MITAQPRTAGTAQMGLTKEGIPVLTLIVGESGKTFTA